MTLKDDVFRFIAKEGEVSDESGFATSKIHDALKYSTMGSISHVLRTLDFEGNIKRLVNGKKTYSIRPTEMGWKNAKALFGIEKFDSASGNKQEEIKVDDATMEVIGEKIGTGQEEFNFQITLPEAEEAVPDAEEAHGRVEEVAEPQPPSVDEVGAAVIAELRRLWQQEAEVKKTLADAKQELGDLRESHKRAYEELKASDAKLDNYRGEIADLKSKLTANEFTIEELKKDNAKKISVIDSLTGQVNALNKRLEEAKRPLGGSLSMDEWSRIGKAR